MGDEKNDEKDDEKELKKLLFLDVLLGIIGIAFFIINVVVLIVNLLGKPSNGFAYIITICSLMFVFSGGLFTLSLIRFIKKVRAIQSMNDENQKNDAK